MAWHGLGRTAQAIEYGRRALTAADRTGYQILEDRARAVLARIASSEPPPVAGSA